MSWRAASAVHMERALLERCPNTLLRRRAPEALKSQVQPRITLSDLALTPKRGLRPIATAIPTPICKPNPIPASLPCYTSLAEIIPIPGSPMVERVVSPRTPMRNRLVEKAARAYLLPSDSFNKRHSQSTPWTQSFSRFLPRLSVLTMALNPFNAFSSAVQVFRFYLTGARALQPQLSNSVSRSVSRSISMPVQRTCYTHDLSIRKSSSDSGLASTWKNHTSFEYHVDPSTAVPIPFTEVTFWQTFVIHTVGSSGIINED